MGSTEFLITSTEPLIEVPSAKTLSEYLLEKAEEFSQKGKDYYEIDAISKETRYFNQFDLETKKIAGALYKLGLRKGDVVIYMPVEQIKLHIFLAGVWRANGICRASYPDDDAATLIDRIKEHKCKFLLCDKNQVEKVQETLDSSVTIITAEHHPDCISIGNILETDNGTYCPPLQVCGDDPALVLCTSGTSGPAKGAVFTHSTMVQLINYFSYQPFSENKPNILFCHATHYGGSLFTYSLLACGKTAIVMGKFTKEVLWKMVDEMKPGCIYSHPTYLLTLVSQEAKYYDFSSLEYLITGGSVITPAIKNALVRIPTLKDVVIVYGLTETGVVVTSAIYRRGIGEKLNYKNIPDFAVGKPIPGSKIQIRDLETFKPLPANQKGEICIFNECLFHSYFNKPESTKNTFIDGYLRTGDIGYYDEEGFLYVVDRLKEIFKYCNYHISPSELENIIGQHPAVDEVCVVGVPDPLGDLPRAFVTVTAGTQPTPTLIKEIVEYTHSKLPSYKHLKGGLYIIPELPTGKTGKITRNLVAKIKVNE